MDVRDLRARLSSWLVRVERTVLLLRMMVMMIGSDSDDSDGDMI